MLIVLMSIGLLGCNGLNAPLGMTGENTVDSDEEAEKQLQAYRLSTQDKEPCRFYGLVESTGQNCGNWWEKTSGPLLWFQRNGKSSSDSERIEQHDRLEQYIRCMQREYQRAEGKVMARELVIAESLRVLQNQNDRRKHYREEMLRLRAELAQELAKAEERESQQEAAIQQLRSELAQEREACRVAMQHLHSELTQEEASKNKAMKAAGLNEEQLLDTEEYNFVR